jgi:WD40 repeat protein
MIFISYARADSKALASALKRDLAEDGESVFMDTDIPGGIAWQRRIEDAIQHCDIVLALMSEGSYDSEYCRIEEGMALDLGKRVLPVLVQRTAPRSFRLYDRQYYDFSDAADYASTLQRLRADIRLGRQYANPLARRARLPALPAHYLERSAPLEILVETVCRRRTRNLIITAAEEAGSIGKSVMAQAMCHHPDTAAAFPDGVIWLRFGRDQRNVAEKLAFVGKTLGDDESHYATGSTASIRLATLLPSMSLLLVVDDVPDDPKVLAPFLVDAPGCSIVFTTRYRALAARIGATELVVDALQPAEAYTLLQRLTGSRDDALLTELAIALQGHPLALDLAARTLTYDTRNWLDTLLQLQGDLPSETRSAIFDALVDLRVRLLEPAQQRLYWTLSILPDTGGIPFETAARFWRRVVREIDPKVFVSRLVRLDLARVDDTNRVWLPSALRSYARSRLGADSIAAHAELLASGANDSDSYLIEHLVHHLDGAGVTEPVKAEFLNFDRLQRALTTSGVPPVLARLDALADTEALRAVRDFVRGVSHVLSEAPHQLPSQFLGRLSSSSPPELATLVTDVQAWNGYAWLRPMTASLTKRTPTDGLHPLEAHKVDGDFELQPDGIIAFAVPRRLHTSLVRWNPRSKQATFSPDLSDLAAYALHSDRTRAAVVSRGGSILVQHVNEDGAHREFRTHPFNYLRRLIASVPIVVFSSLIAFGAWRTYLHNPVLLVVPIILSFVWFLLVAIAEGFSRGSKLGLVAEGVSFGILYAVVSPFLLAEYLNHYMADAQFVSDGLLLCESNPGLWRMAIVAVDTGKSSRGLWGMARWVRLSACGNYLLEYHWSIVSGSHLRLRETQSGRIVGTHRGFKCSKRPDTFCWDGARALFSCDKRGQDALAVWDPSARTVTFHELGRFLRLATTPTGDFAVALKGSTFYLWDLQGRKLAIALAPKGLEVRAVAVAPGGGSVLVACGRQYQEVDQLFSWDTKAFGFGHSDRITAVALTENAATAISASEDGRLKIWRVSDGLELVTLAGHSAAIQGVAVAGGGTRVISASAQEVCSWSLDGGNAATVTPGNPIRPAAKAATPKGEALCVAPSIHGDMTLAALQCARELDGRAEGVGEQRALLRTKDSVTLLNLDTNEQRAVMRGCSQSIAALAVSADFAFAIFSDGANVIRGWNLECDCELPLRLEHADTVTCLAVTPEGRFAASTSLDKTVRLWDLRTGGTVASFTTDVPLTACSISADGRTIVAGDVEGTLHFLQLEGAASVF